MTRENGNRQDPDGEMPELPQTGNGAEGDGGTGEALAVQSVTVPEGVDEEPERFAKMVLAAGFRMLDCSWNESARRVGVDASTLRRWRQRAAWRDSWEAAVELAADKWFSETDIEARRAVLRAIRSGDRVPAQWFLERTDDRLEKAEGQRQAQAVNIEVNLAGPDAGGREIEVEAS